MVGAISVKFDPLLAFTVNHNLKSLLAENIRNVKNWIKMA